MVPKIIDFGISRWFDETRPCYYFKSDGISVSRLSLSKALKVFFPGFTFKLCIHYLLISCRGYVLLEFFFSGIITFKSDIYNLSLYINIHGDIDCDEEVFWSWLCMNIYHPSMIKCSNTDAMPFTFAYCWKHTQQP